MSDIVMMECQPCALGFHWECADPTEEPGGGYFCCCVTGQKKGLPVDEDEDGAEGFVTNNLTTGRKRAGRLHEVLTGMSCEWSGLRYAGGGIVPIVGCSGNVLAKVKRGADLPPGTDSRGELHHGPDKTTLNNGPLNLHRICSACHHRWHALNDQFYETPRPGPSEPWLPSDGDRRVWPHDVVTLATEEELEASEDWWAIRTEKRPPYPFGRDA